MLLALLIIGSVFNQVNAAIRERLVQEGEFFIVQTRVVGKFYLRTTLMNPYTTEVELGALLERVRELANIV